MATEKQYVLQTISNVKIALAQRDDGTDSDDTIVGTSNRGCKLKRGAKNVHERKLDDGRGVNGYKEEIEYYGRRKKIIYRRKRIAVDSDDEGPEDNGRSSSELSDPYKGIDLGKLLAPLESAADLPSHPSLSHIYLSRTLNELLQQSLDKICEEQAHTIKLKNLFTQFLGDDPWVNLEKMQWPDNDHEAVARERSELLLRQYLDIQNIHATARASVVGRMMGVETNGKLVNGTPKSNENSTGENEDVEMGGVNGHSDSSGVQDGAADANGELDASNEDAPPPLATQDTIVEDEEPKIPKTEDTSSHDEGLRTREPTPRSVPEPRRMTTRSAHHNNATISPPLSETPPVEVDPFFYPPNYHVDRDYGLSPNEAEETRRLLSAAVQRQDEFLRGLKKVQHGLLRAENLRQKVWEWCRTMEGMKDYHEHLAKVSGNPNAANYDIDTGEGVGLSDGEDWYDMDAWNLDEPLEKGREEEEEGDEVVRGKKTRRRGDR